MLFCRKLTNVVFSFLFLNSILVFAVVWLPLPLRVSMATLLAAFFVFYNILPRGSELPFGKAWAMVGGYELLLSAGVCFLLEVSLYLFLIRSFPGQVKIAVLVANGIFYIFFTGLVLANGAIRIFATSGQLSLPLRILLLCLWWVPVANVVLFILVEKTVREEYLFQCRRHKKNQARLGLGVCRTRYPLLLVHGIFFRDWDVFNYWGRIPAELIQNGSVVYYGKQQSSASVEQSAMELKQRILEVLAETGSEKVNIIAHSKGGLDARYAISCLDMAGQVASLTTINTPHYGCTFAGRALQKAPKKLVGFIDKNYNKLFQRVGDKTPDFFSGVNELTVEKCAQLNGIMPNAPEVYYQSVGSKMKNSGSAIFPLNISYQIINTMEGENDGLVHVNSMPWGHFLGLLVPQRRKGISHGDMIDLTRKNIPGFDVCEYYIELVAGIKEMGY